MKTTKPFLLLLMLFFSINFYGGSAKELPRNNVDPLNKEITRMLSRSTLIVERDHTVTIFFTLSQEKVIHIRSISSPHAGVNQFLKERLEGKKLYGANWVANKVYELPVRIKAVL